MKKATYKKLNLDLPSFITMILRALVLSVANMAKSLKHRAIEHSIMTWIKRNYSLEKWKLSNVCELFLVESWRWRIVISQACYVEVYNIQVLIGYVAQNVLITIEQFLRWKTNMNINQLFLSALNCKKQYMLALYFFAHFYHSTGNENVPLHKKRHTC